MGEGCHASHQPSDASTPSKLKTEYELGFIIAFEVCSIYYLIHLLCCVYAGSLFEEKTEADVTEHNDKPRPYVCTVCDKRFIEKFHLIQHSEIHKGDENTYSCTQCEKSFTTRRYLAYHMNVHSGKYKCIECGMCFKNNRLLRDHQRSHKRFSRKDGLTLHSKEHADEKPFSCPECEKSFSHQQNLRTHMYVHSNRYKCPECGKCCRSKHILTAHRRSHSGEKPYECTVCGRRFAHSGDLVVHRRIHSGEKPYKCLVCGKAFGRSQRLKSHVRSHTTDELNVQSCSGMLWLCISRVMCSVIFCYEN